VILDEAAAAVVASTLAGPPTLGAGRLLCVDGPSGSGKTTLAAAVVRILGDGAQVVRMDDLYDGWAGLEAGMATVATSVVARLRSGDAGRYRRYDWHRSAFAEERVVPPCEVLVVEGVGSGGSSYDDAIGCLAWMDAPADVRLARSVARDGEVLRERLLAWQELEDAMFARELTRERADVVVDGQTGTVRK
jgi:uridine kinase